MGKTTGFMEYERQTGREVPPKERIKNWKEFHLPLREEEQRRQGARCMDCGVPFCQSGMMMGGMVSGCPLNNLIPEWNDLIYTGNWQQAFNRLKKTNSFPEFTSRVCPAPCEAACTCGLNGDPVSVKENERAIIEKAYQSGWARVKPPRVRTGKKIAVVGSGPAGLAAADQLNKRGHSVTVYEKSDRLGGLLMYGIPNMKLEKWVIDRKIDIMRQEGISFVTNADVGRGLRANKLMKEYDRIILACGAGNPRDIDVPGRDAQGIYFAVDFLKATTKSLLDSNLEDGAYISAKDKHVVVIGGGDTGNDCVGTSIRHGCASVTQLEMMPKPPVKRAPPDLSDHGQGVHKRRGRPRVQSHPHKPHPPERPRDRPHHHGPGRRQRKRNPCRLSPHRRRLPGLPALRGRSLRRRPNATVKRGHCFRRIPDQCRKNIHSRRHAPRPVIGRLGNTRRKRSRKRSRQKSDGVYKLGIATSSAHKSRESQKGKFTFHSAVFCSYAYGASRP